MEKSNPNKSKYTATCAECGVKFELPFIPTSDKPVYCNNCFKNKKNQGRSDNRRDRNRKDRQMFTAICDKCGKKAQVPFKPSGDKPIYCDDCFGKRNKGGQKSDNLQEVNKKLDMIINALVDAKIIKLPKEESSSAPTDTKASNDKKKENKTKKAPARKKAAPKKKPVAKKKAPTKKKTITPKGSSKTKKKK
ncbi:MAG: hypothetical protein GF365_02890 [Candidatus Buchananbacteria bacterium]|nr:hypothetical protein [Candidatus Buchananbacteria bacterium]